MTVRRDGDVIRLEGDCPVAEAEMLAALLEGGVGRIVDLALCGSAHSASDPGALALPTGAARSAAKCFSPGDDCASPAGRQPAGRSLWEMIAWKPKKGRVKAAERC